jgi:hypothetical protein
MALASPSTTIFQLVVVSVRGQTLLVDMTANEAAWNAVRPHLEAFLTGFQFPVSAGG